MKFRIILFLSGFLFLHTVTNAQTVTTVTGSYCVGSQTVFVLVGSSCSSYSWSVSSGTNGIDYTITGSSNAQAYQVNWLRPISGNVRCSYVCNGSSGAAYSSNFTVSNKVAPSVSISSNVGTTACQGSSVTFTATPTNGGTSPNYNWMINGTTISSGSSNTFVRTNLVNGDIVSVVLSSNFTCLTTTTATSNSLTMTITQPSPVTVTVTGSSIICSASSTNSSFVASATNTGSSPVYTWYKNGGQVTGASGPPPYVYVPQTALANGDKITCKVTSNASCISGNPATSNEYVVSLTTSVTPSVGIPITKLVYCTGEIMSLTASSSYLTGSSTYSWKLNGTQFATTSSTTLPVSTDINAVNTFSPGDVVTVSVTGLTGTCLTATTATGSTSGVPFVIGSPPSVTINPSGNWSMSSQSTMDITATSGLSYQWKRDGLPISPGGNVNPYTATMSGAYTVVGTSNGCSTESNTLNLRKNTIPIANAGPDITTNPAQPLVMAGSGTDDTGLVNSTTIPGLGPIWTQVSGPTVVVFDNIQSYTPTVTDIVIGQYVFSFTVIDYNLERSLPDYVTINVTVPPNNYNWIKETTVLVKGKLQETDLTSLQVTTGEKNVSLNYYDGLGRPMQSIKVQASPAFKDKLVPIVYDGYGRENAKYLPFTMINNNGYYQKKSDIIDPATGNYKGNAANFYSDSNPFSETSFEFSSLDRPLKEFGAGNDWRADNKFTEYRHLTNTHYVTGSGLSLTAEKIVAWKITSGLPTRALSAAGIVEAGGYYSTGQLLIRSTKDENGYETRDYTDKLGRIVLKKEQVSSTVNSLDDNTQWALTYYIYDDFGNLRFVFQPVLSATVLGSDTYAPQQADMDRLAFQYNYDEKQRQVEKKVPGADWVYFIYDKLNRLVMTQNGNQRKDINNNQKNDWTITKYDMLNRPVITAIYTHTAFVSRTTMAGLISTTNFFESYNGIASTHGYTSVVFPTSGFQVLTVLYYDNYKFRDDFGLAAATSFGYTTGDITGQDASYNTSVIGFVTGSKINKIGTTNYLFNVNYFDQKYRTIQAKNQNQFGSIDRSTNLYDFVRIKETKSFHTKGTTTHTIRRRFDYDHVGRMERTWFTLNTQPEILLIKNTYNELGQLIDKKLHSTVASASDAVQSVDYRYNIRGWLTSINNASLTNDVTTNDDGTDYFGMNLSYNTVDTDLANGKQYSGNIAAIKWSNYPGTGPAKQKGYTYTYDPMNRISSSLFKEKNATWASAANNGFSETGYSYDLNGNIIKMKRNDKRDTGWMDDMTYYYGVPGLTQSNRLLRVEDSGDDYTGFVDGNPGTDDDYTYDNNGNMTRDRNKGLGVPLIENGDFIVYNFLNLPETITKRGNTVKYIYDATGRKLSQIVTSGGTQKQTDYFGDFTYENDELQFINNEEGRIMMTSSKLISFNNGEELISVGALNNANLSLVTQQNDKQKYVQATTAATTQRTGIFPIGSDIPVAASERYRIRVKGYSTGPSVVNLLIKINGNDLNFPGVAFPSSAVTESWLEQIITIPASYGTSAIMQTGVVWSAASATDIIYFNELEITKLQNQSASPEFQYVLKDHLGNARLTFTTKPETESSTATMELASRPSEGTKFLRYDKVRIVDSQPMFDHTNGTANGSSIRLSGGPDDKTGLLKTISVMPGDVVNMEVYAKYLDQTTSNWTATLTSLVSAIASGSTSYITDGTYYSNNHLNPFPLTGKNGTTSSPGTGPKAFLCYHSFDRDFNPITPEADPSQTFYVRMDESAKEDGKSGPNGVPHQRLFASVTVKQAGYMSIYLSNQESSPVEVYFDDFKVEQIKSPIIQTNDYYPFGLTYNSYTRESGALNDYLFNGKEKQDELDLGWYDYGARMYISEIGRWVGVDPLIDSYHSFSPYSYALDNPVNAIDPDGEKVIFVNGYWNRALNYMGMAPGAPKEAYWNYFDPEFIPAARNFLHASTNELNYFVDASSVIGFDQDGADRHELGRRYAEEHYDELIAGMTEGEEFRIVSHSEGAAFAAGMSEYLNERWDLAHSPNHLVTDLLYLSPDEVEDFESPGVRNSNQLHIANDPVSDAKPLKGAQYTELKGSKARYAHGGTVTKRAIQKLQKILTQFSNSGDVEKIETPEGTTYRRKD